MMICKMAETCSKWKTCYHGKGHDKRTTCDTRCTDGEPSKEECRWEKPSCRKVEGHIVVNPAWSYSEERGVA